MLRRLIRTALLTGGLTALTGCFPPYGTSKAYIEGATPVKVVMPPNAPSIQQQFSAGHHLGIDVVGPIGAPVIAVMPGRVVASRYEPAYGERVELDHGRDAEGRRILTRYVHLETRKVRVGDTVERGAQIATLGNTGILAAGIPHLHYEFLRDASWGTLVPVDPHLFWADGPGRVTCFEPGGDYPRLATTYPVPCAPDPQAAALSNNSRQR